MLFGVACGLTGAAYEICEELGYGARARRQVRQEREDREREAQEYRRGMERALQEQEQVAQEIEQALQEQEQVAREIEQEEQAPTTPDADATILLARGLDLLQTCLLDTVSTATRAATSGVCDAFARARAYLRISEGWIPNIVWPGPRIIRHASGEWYICANVLAAGPHSPVDAFEVTAHIHFIGRENLRIVSANFELVPRHTNVWADVERDLESERSREHVRSLLTTAVAHANEPSIINTIIHPDGNSVPSALRGLHTTAQGVLCEVGIGTMILRRDITVIARSAIRGNARLLLRSICAGQRRDLQADVVFYIREGKLESFVVTDTTSDLPERAVDAPGTSTVPQATGRFSRCVRLPDNSVSENKNQEPVAS
jgi:hypothetical protein